MKIRWKITIPQISCKIFKSDKVNKRELDQKLRNYRNEISQQDVSKPIVENIEKFTLLSDGVKFKFLYDYVIPVLYRNQTQKILKTAEAEVKIIDPYNRNIYITYASDKIADGIKIRLSRILSNTDDFIESIFIPPNDLREIGNEDAIEIKYGWWKDIEIYVSKGALKGNLKRSRFYTDFENSGDPTLLIFESQSTGITIRITTKGIITFYSLDVTEQVMEEYILRRIIPRLNIWILDCKYFG